MSDWLIEELLGDDDYQPLPDEYDDEPKALGGPGSGNFGHAGRPGRVGGSGASGLPLERAARVKQFDMQQIPAGAMHRIMVNPQTGTIILSKMHSDPGSNDAMGETHSGVYADAMGDNTEGFHQTEFDNYYRGFITGPEPGFPKGRLELMNPANYEVDPDDITEDDIAQESDAVASIIDQLVRNGGLKRETLIEGLHPVVQESLPFMFPSRKSRALGGPGSGNFGHSGRPGQIGGSSPSLIAGDDGQPLTLYHGTIDPDLTHPDPAFAVENSGVTFFTDNEDVAWGYTFQREYGETVGDSSENVIKANISMRNPLVVDMDGDVGDALVLATHIREAKVKGHDGVIFKNIDDSVSGDGSRGTSYAVFDAKQIHLVEKRDLGGPGSGNFGHKGRPGEIGGSTSGGQLLFHGTRGDNLDSILKTGLTSKRGVVYATTDFSVAKIYAENSSSKHVAILEIHVPPGQEEEVLLQHRLDSAKSHYIDRAEKIPVSTATHFPASWIRVVHERDSIAEGSWRFRQLAAATILYVPVVLNDANLRELGGPGSGNFGHKGRPGQVGGSSSDGGGSRVPLRMRVKEKERASKSMKPARIAKPRAPKKVETITVYHNSPDEFPDNKPNFSAYFGDEDFRKSFPNEWGEHTYAIDLPTEKLLDLDKGSDDAREFMAIMATIAYPNDPGNPEFIEKLRAGDQEAVDDFYEAWTSKENVTHALSLMPKYEAVRFRSEFVVPIETLDKLQGRKFTTLGGPGSGNFGHAGRPGEVGGSAPEGSRVFKTPDDVKLNKGWYGEKDYYTWKDKPGMMVTGRILDKADIPDTLYHVTTNASAVEGSGYLRGQNADAGLGGGQEDGVSFTTDLTDAKVIQRELKRAVEIARGDHSIESIERFAREDEREAGLEEGALNNAVSFARRNWDVNIQSPVYDSKQKKDSLLEDVFKAYLQIRGNSNKPELKNPLLFGRQEQLRKIDPANVRTLHVPKAGIPDRALVTSGSDDFLHEVRVYADVPVRGMRVAGGPGSGNFGHAGRPGQVGGSAPDGDIVDRRRSELDAYGKIANQIELDYVAVRDRVTAELYKKYVDDLSVDVTKLIDEHPDVVKAKAAYEESGDRYQKMFDSYVAFEQADKDQERINKTTRRAYEVAEQLHMDPSIIDVVDTTPRPFKVGDKEFVEAGHFNPTTGRVQLNVNGSYDDRMAVTTHIAAHELSHVMWHDVRNRWEKERAQFNAMDWSEMSKRFRMDGSPKPEFAEEIAREFPVSTAMAKVWGDSNVGGWEHRDQMIAENGHTAYAKSYWDVWRDNNVQAPNKQDRAVDESLAEVTAFMTGPDQNRFIKEPSKKWIAFAKTVHRLYRKGQR
jgi:hypothetical protein